ncbi:PREDICTED: olfactory receptor 24-like [Nanorana parkeri]|uniref:olfactory receptor 24-like n=1 Tax=Nanorana parkeri TaxID=125878 RepID=UPI00085449A3|nr:PREDICTED: olfactory receptor 24-like [Nanorana parkeri]
MSDMESFLFVVMSYDRYLAICQLLRYSALMNTRLCLYLVIVFWFVTLAIVTTMSYFLMNMGFCGPVRIDHFHCDLTSLISLACSDITSFISLTLVISNVLSVSPLVAAFVSYTFIIISILKIKTSTGRKKAFSTCSSHLVVLGVHCAIVFALYVVPRNKTYFQVYKGMSFSYFAVTPLINAIIYTVRNQDFHKALKATIN